MTINKYKYAVYDALDKPHVLYNLFRVVLVVNIKSSLPENNMLITKFTFLFFLKPTALLKNRKNDALWKAKCFATTASKF